VCRPNIRPILLHHNLTLSFRRIESWKSAGRVGTSMLRRFRRRLQREINTPLTPHLARPGPQLAVVVADTLVALGLCLLVPTGIAQRSASASSIAFSVSSTVPRTIRPKCSRTLSSSIRITFLSELPCYPLPWGLLSFWLSSVVFANTYLARAGATAECAKILYVISSFTRATVLNNNVKTS
jgi:hypothetical protein